MSQPVVEVKDLSVIFNIANERIQSIKEWMIKAARHQLFYREFVAVDDISFNVDKGDVFGIVGTNGSGKSTMLKVIAGVLEPSKGSCTVHGSIAPLIELGAGFDEELTADENIYLNGALLGMSKKFLDEHFDEIVDFAELDGFMEMPIKNYSSGMVARIAFSIATAIVPDLLIVDEVLAVGDYRFQQKCEKRITDLIDKHGTTVVIVSHSNDQIERMCNRALWIEKSKLQMIGDAREVCKAYASMDSLGAEGNGVVDDASRTLADGTYFIDLACDGGRPVGIAASSLEDGANAVVCSESVGNARGFTCTYLGHGYYSIKSAASGKALDVEGGSVSAGSNVLQWSYRGADNQQWMVKDEGDHSYSIISRSSGLYLGVSDATPSEGAVLRIWPYSGEPNQRFAFEPVEH